MKHLYKIWLYVVALLTVTSCADNDPLGFLVDEPATLVSQDSINAYKPLMSYVDSVTMPNFLLGANISMPDYLTQGVVYRLVNNNFKQISLRRGIRHGDLVQSDGSLVTDSLSTFLKVVKSSGISVFGGSLIDYQGQNATYLNSLIASTVFSPPAIANSLNLTNLKNSTFTGWGISNSGAGISIASGAGIVSGTNAIKMVSGSTSSNATDLELITPDITAVSGHKFEVILFIKSDADGEGRLAFEGLDNNTPRYDWMGTGAQTTTFKTNISWKKVRCQVSAFTGSTFKVHLDLGYKPNVTYYIDVNNFYVYDTQGSASIVNLISNADFEAGNVTGWGGWGNSATFTVSSKGQGYGNSGYCLKVYNPSITSGYWGVQSSYTITSPEINQKYTLSFDYKADNTGTIIPELQSSTYTSDGYGSITLSTSWQHFEKTITCTNTDRIRLIISYGSMAGTVYLDNFMLYKSNGQSTSNITIVQTDTEKKKYIGDAMQSWISGIVPKCSTVVKSWDVVKNMLSNASPYGVRTGVGLTQASDEFYWWDYLGGKDCAVQAFKYARQNCNSTDKLFISDYNLENTDKCNALISLKTYIESQGQTVDGFSTQMHISLSTDKTSITNMFKLLAATGKLVRISELYIDCGSSSPTSTLLQQQANMYKYVVQAYYQQVPVAQRYGITVSNAFDVNQGIWNSSTGYVRKPAYAKFADGLAGK